MLFRWCHSVAFACSCNDESNVPLTPAITFFFFCCWKTTTWGTSFNWGEERDSSPTHRHTQKYIDEKKRIQNQKKNRRILYIFKNDNRAQPWSGQMMDRPASSHSALDLSHKTKWERKKLKSRRTKGRTVDIRWDPSTSQTFFFFTDVCSRAAGFVTLA